MLLKKTSSIMDLKPVEEVKKLKRKGSLDTLLPIVIESPLINLVNLNKSSVSREQTASILDSTQKQDSK
jgi:hypothetical protein